MPITNDTKPAIINFIMHFLLFIFYYKALESLQNCIESSAIMDDFLQAVSSSVILPTNLLTLPLIISQSSITLELRVSTLLLALKILIKSSIFTLSLSLSFGMLQFFYCYVALFRNDDAKDIEDDSFDINNIWVYYLFYAEYINSYDVVGSTKLHWPYSKIKFFGISQVFLEYFLIHSLRSLSERDSSIIVQFIYLLKTTRRSLFYFVESSFEIQFIQIVKILKQKGDSLKNQKLPSMFKKLLVKHNNIKNGPIDKFASNFFIKDKKQNIIKYKQFNYLYILRKMEEKYDLLKCTSQKSIMKELKNGQVIYMSCPIFKFNDYKKKQQRGLLITSLAVYNLKGSDIKRRIETEKIKGISFSKIGTEFILHVPSEYDYRYSSTDLRDRIIYYILKSHWSVTKQKLPIYYRDQLNLVFYAMTKEDKKKFGVKQIKGSYVLHNDQSYKQYIDSQQNQRQAVRKTTKTLFSKQHTNQSVTLSDFTPKVVLGKGAFGTVLLVQKKGTKQLYAMKSISKDDVVKKDQIQHTKTQKIILEHVNHPFLVNLAYAFQTPQKLYFVMNFMKGGQLFQHLANAKRFSQNQAKFYVMQIALGLGHLHDKDFIYRDLKLENILMDEYGNVSLTDFGMAKIITQGQLAQTFCGTPEYIAPEVLDGKGYDKSADWWSLGILTYEMMYGLPPFYHNSQKQMFKKIKQGEFRFSQKVKVSDQAKDFIVKLLNQNPKKRLGSTGQSNEVLAHPWFKGLDPQKMMKKQIKPPFKPSIQGQDWLEGFDKQFTSQKPVVEDKSENSSNNQYEKVFKNF